ncbi:Multi antimicrobial extrusion protein [Indibacter alkaliphilus LW1]|uniref:Multidrug-efflux transporter n=1 Tax=Indibacter alkaliphilus (strain CCUG 57479 / KCTC 22604 / LW1) TaxID=1189612 RepID=S2DUH0_INDAL|nr:MATE family efflux transporter [Indibacter alkaliphilus]EOZ95731.1 Multi antimicrobial extrusion protein [Indibacter alkaliphilus LW1]
MALLNFKDNFSKTFDLAYPVMLSQLGQVLVGVADSMMVGRLGAEPLAAASLANSIFFVVLMFGIGVSMAITPLVAMADGNKNFKKIASIFNHGFIINMLTGVMLFLLIVFFSPMLNYMNQPEEVVVLAIPYLAIITLSLLPFMFFQTFRQFAEGLSQTKQAMYITLLCNGLNVFLNWVLIYGNLGFPAMGLNGAGWATLISRVLMGLIMAYYVIKSKRYKGFQLSYGIKKLNFPMVSKMLKIGVPTGFQYIFEVGAFSTAAIMMGWIGVNALAAHQIAINLASVSYMMASGLSAAAMVRVGNQLGRRDIPSLRDAGFTVFVMVAIFMSISAVIFILFREYLPSLYIDDLEVIRTSATLLVIAGFFQLSDGVQVVGLGALRGMSDVKVPTIVTLIAYWVIGLPLGYFFSFTLGMQEVGIWYGLLIGLTVTGILLLYRFHTLSKKMLNTHQKSDFSPVL